MCASHDSRSATCTLARPSCTDSCKTQLKFLPTLTQPPSHLHPCYVWPPGTSQFSCTATVSPLALFPVTSELIRTSLFLANCSRSLTWWLSPHLPCIWQPAPLLDLHSPTYYPSCLPGPSHALYLTPSSPGCPLPLPAVPSLALRMAVIYPHKPITSGYRIVA